MAEIRKTNIFQYLKTKYNNVASIVKMNGTQSAGSSDYIARADHVHPTDTSRAASNHSHGSLVNDGALNSDITSVNKVAVTDATNKLKTISKLPLDKVTHQDISGKANVNHSHDSASSSANGFLSKEDKSKLDGIATEANKTVVDSSLSSSSNNPVQNKVVNSALNGKANSSHTHSISNITNLQSALDSKSETGHTHDDRYYTETEMNTKLNGKANSSHTHSIGNVTNLQAKLDTIPSLTSTSITVSGTGNQGVITFYKFGKIVIMELNLSKVPLTTSWNVVGTVPQGYLPKLVDGPGSQQDIFWNVQGKQGQSAQLNIKNTGEIRFAYGNGNTTLIVTSIVYIVN